MRQCFNSPTSVLVWLPAVLYAPAGNQRGTHIRSQHQQETRTHNKYSRHDPVCPALEPVSPVLSFLPWSVLLLVFATALLVSLSALLVASAVLLLPHSKSSVHYPWPKGKRRKILVGQIRRYERDKSFCGPTSLSCFRRHLWGGGVSKDAHTHPHRCLRKHDRLVRPQRNKVMLFESPALHPPPPNNLSPALLVPPPAASPPTLEHAIQIAIWRQNDDNVRLCVIF